MWGTAPVWRTAGGRNSYQTAPTGTMTPASPPLYRKVQWPVRGRQTNSSRYFPVSAYGRVTVVKACGESDSCGPSEHYWWQDDCDRKSDEDSYTCTTCCTTPSCNSAPRLHSLPGILLCLLISLNKSSNSWRSLSFLTARIQLTGFIFIFW